MRSSNINSRREKSEHNAKAEEEGRQQWDEESFDGVLLAFGSRHFEHEEPGTHWAADEEKDDCDVRVDLQKWI